jgi:hypothetical protein
VASWIAVMGIGKYQCAYPIHGAANDAMGVTSP